MGLASGLDTASDIDRRFFKVRELQALHQVDVKFVPTDLNAADILTKPVSPAAFARHSAT